MTKTFVLFFLAHMSYSLVSVKSKRALVLQTLFLFSLRSLLAPWIKLKKNLIRLESTLLLDTFIDVVEINAPYLLIC